MHGVSWWQGARSAMWHDTGTLRVLIARPDKQCLVLRLIRLSSEQFLSALSVSVCQRCLSVSVSVDMHRSQTIKSQTISSAQMSCFL